MDFQAMVQAVLRDVSAYQGQGVMPTYIPSLAQVNPRKLGLAVALGDGSIHTAGDADERFSIQSISNVFTLSIALQHVGSALWNHVGREASGAPIDAIVQLAMEKGKPRNPLLNACAIVVGVHLIREDNADVAV